MSHKKTQKNTSIKSGKQHLNKTRSLINRYKLFKKKQILELKNSMNEGKNAIESTNSRFDQTEESVKLITRTLKLSRGRQSKKNEEE